MVLNGFRLDMSRKNLTRNQIQIRNPSQPPILILNRTPIRNLTLIPSLTRTHLMIRIHLRMRAEMKVKIPEAMRLRRKEELNDGKHPDRSGKHLSGY